jgi:hypothetical protein
MAKAAGNSDSLDLQIPRPPPTLPLAGCRPPHSELRPLPLHLDQSILRRPYGADLHAYTVVSLLSDETLRSRRPC